MNTRPLDLAARLRPEPRSFDWLFFVNGGFLLLFFMLFGSKFVLAPSLGVDFRLPEQRGANDGARPATHHVSITNSGQILVPEGLLTLDEFKRWLRDQAAAAKSPVLLVQAGEAVKISLLTEVVSAARAAGFVDVRLATEEPRPAGGSGPHR